MHQTLAGSICCKKYGKIKQVEAHSLYTSTKEKGIYIHKLASKKRHILAFFQPCKLDVEHPVLCEKQDSIVVTTTSS